MKQRIQEARKKQQERIGAIQEKGYANVTFIVSSLSMWQHQSIYDIMSANPHFHVNVLYAPFSVYSAEDAVNGWKQCQAYFSSKSITITNINEIKAAGKDFRKEYAPDIIFYPQWYEGIYDEMIDIQHFYDCLICLIPYGMLTISLAKCNCYTANFLAWRYYLGNYYEKHKFKMFSPNKADNIVVSGYPLTERYINLEAKSAPWKKQEKTKKKIIWAPHFTISGADSNLHRSSFLEIADIMWNIAERYKDKVQFAFKPHPRLMTELYNNKSWGKEKTDKYYKKWETSESTQFENGEYEELFKSSDAMIHDSGSFTCEYMYVNKPVLFTSGNPEKLKISEDMSTMGADAIDAHYHGTTKEEIEYFIEEVVLEGKDRKNKERSEFRESYLTLRNEKTASQIIYEDICFCLGFPSKPQQDSSNARLPRISVILPIFNCERYLRESLQSIINQTYKDLEIICVDDGSDDSSPEILKEYKAKDSRIKVYNQTNSGTLAARKKGTENATGQYILFVDPDDWIDPETCKALAMHVSHSAIDILQYGFTIECTDNNTISNAEEIDNYFNKQAPYIDGTENIVRECFKEKNIGFNQPGKLIRTEIVKKAFGSLPLMRCNYAEDMCAGLVILIESATYRQISKNFYHYRCGVGISTKRAISLEDFKIMTRALALFDCIKKKEYPHINSKLLHEILDTIRRDIVNDLIYNAVRKSNDIELANQWVETICQAADHETIISSVAPSIANCIKNIMIEKTKNIAILSAEIDNLNQTVVRLSKKNKKRLVQLKIAIAAAITFMLLFAISTI